MKKVVTPVVITAMVIMITILSVATMAEETVLDKNNTVLNNVAPNASNVKISIKSKFLEVEKNRNIEKIRINITIDRLGRLVYMENYYSQGGEGPKFYGIGRYYDANLTNSSVTFNISRPRGNNRTYLFIQSIVLLNNTVIFEQWLSLPNRTKLGNIKSPVNETKKSTRNNTIINNVTSKPRPKSLSGTDNINNSNDINKADKQNDISLSENSVNIVDKEMTKKSPGFGIITAITVISIIRIFKTSLISKVDKLRRN